MLIYCVFITIKVKIISQWRKLAEPDESNNDLNASAAGRAEPRVAAWGGARPGRPRQRGGSESSWEGTNATERTVRLPFKLKNRNLKTFRQRLGNPSGKEETAAWSSRVWSVSCRRATGPEAWTVVARQRGRPESGGPAGAQEIHPKYSLCRRRSLKQFRVKLLFGWRLQPFCEVVFQSFFELCPPQSENFFWD